MPEYVYYIIGAAVAILVMVLIIVFSKKSKHEHCECEDCHHEESSLNENEQPSDETQVQETSEPRKEETVEEVKEESKETVENTEEQQAPENVEEKQTPATTEKELSKKEKLNRYRVTYDKVQENWVVKMDGATRASKRCATKEEALKVAKELAKKKDSKLSVHKKDGKFQKKANIK